MTKIRGWPVRAMYMLIAAALVISLIITVAPAQKVSADPGLSEWDMVSTPTMEGWVVAPNSTIIDAAYADGGEVAYAVVYAWDEACVNATPADDDYRLLKSDDYAATWDDLTGTLEDVDDTPPITAIYRVATDWVEPDFVAVALMEAGEIRVYFSTDGGSSFEDADGQVVDGTSTLSLVSDLAVSPESGGKREIAIGGQDTDSAAALFRSTVSGDAAGGWEDATDYDGWDDKAVPSTPAGPLDSDLVTDIIFSSSWGSDKTILVTTVDDYNDTIDAPGIAIGDVHLQCGSWSIGEGWNEYSTLGIEAVPVLEDVELPWWVATSYDARGIAGMTLPEDYDSDIASDRLLWVWVNYYDPDFATGEPRCALMRVEDDSADLIGPMGEIEDGELWLTNISYHGTIAEGEAIAGVLGNGMGDYTLYCDGVQVYRNDAIRNMDICCERWHDACKPPTGTNAMGVAYVDDDKAYAVALQGDNDYDEGAWSVTFDDGDTWNQLSLIDTNIDYFSDVAVSPDCNKTMLVSVHEDEENGGCYCDSVWLHAVNLPEAEEYSGKWIRTWCGELDYWGLLRLAPEETTGDTVVLVDYDTNNVYQNDLEGLACWDPIGSTELDEIQDLALQDADTFFAIDFDGYVAMFDDDEWQEAVGNDVDHGYTIAVWGDHILVGGLDGDASYSDDGGETFELLEEIPTIDGYVTVAFDTYFDTNGVVYAATNDDGCNTGGIYSFVIGESEEWMDLKAEPLESQIGIDDGDAIDETVEVAFTGLVVDRPGNPFTDADNGGVIYASYYGYAYDDVLGWVWFTGAARSLERTVTVCTTCLTWDFLHVGLTLDIERFEAWPDALKICGCLTPDSNSKLFAIDGMYNYYDMCEGELGAVWTYEDCYAKKAPDITSPADGFVVPADPCSCYSVPFTVLWDTLCDACSYDIAFALDEDFDMPVPVNGETGLSYHVVGDVPSYSIMGGEAGGLSCETTYYVRVRAADAATGEIIHSWWSDPIAVTIAPSQEAGEIALVSPEPGATDVAIEDVGFSWDLLATADSFDWVLDDNSDLSSPVESKTGLTTTAYECTETLGYDTTYYWQVIAYNEGAAISSSAVGTFTTAATGEFCCPQCGLCFDTEAELQAHADEAHPAQPTTPFWVWIVIAIGAVLVIVVIVLIFRTRRV